MTTAQATKQTLPFPKPAKATLAVSQDNLDDMTNTADHADSLDTSKQTMPFPKTVQATVGISYGNLNDRANPLLDGIAKPTLPFPQLSKAALAMASCGNLTNTSDNDAINPLDISKYSDPNYTTPKKWQCCMCRFVNVEKEDQDKEANNTCGMIDCQHRRCWNRKVPTEPHPCRWFQDVKGWRKYYDDAAR